MIYKKKTSYRTDIIFEKERLAAWNSDLPPAENQPAAFNQVGTTHAGYNRQI